MNKKIIYVVLTILSLVFLIYGGRGFIWTCIVTIKGWQGWSHGILHAIYYLGIILIALTISTLTILIKDIFKK